jgi:hypothetical protein
VERRDLARLRCRCRVGRWYPNPAPDVGEHVPQLVLGARAGPALSGVAEVQELTLAERAEPQRE